MKSWRTKMVKLRAWSGENLLWCVTCENWSLVQLSTLTGAITCCDTAGKSFYLLGILKSLLKCTVCFRRSLGSKSNLKTMLIMILIRYLHAVFNLTDAIKLCVLLFTLAISFISFMWEVWCPKVLWWANGTPQNGLLRKPHFHTFLSSPFFMPLK